MGEDELEIYAIGAEIPIDLEKFGEDIQKGFRDRKRKPLKIDLNSLDKIKQFIDKMLEKIHTAIKDYELSEITINLSISHEGKVSIILADASLNVAASIGLKIVKKPPKTIASTDEKTVTTAPNNIVTTVKKDSKTTTKVERSN